jgi:hypothetical protein
VSKGDTLAITDCRFMGTFAIEVVKEDEDAKITQSGNQERGTFVTPRIPVIVPIVDTTGELKRGPLDLGGGMDDESTGTYVGGAAVAEGGFDRVPIEPGKLGRDQPEIPGGGGRLPPHLARLPAPDRSPALKKIPYGEKVAADDKSPVGAGKSAGGIIPGAREVEKIPPGERLPPIPKGRGDDQLPAPEDGNYKYGKEGKAIGAPKVEKDYNFGNKDRYAKGAGFKNDNQFGGGDVKEIRFPGKPPNWIMIGLLALGILGAVILGSMLFSGQRAAGLKRKRKNHGLYAAGNWDDGDELLDVEFGPVPD